MIRLIRTECVAGGVEHIAEKSRDGFWYGIQRMAFEPDSRTGRMSLADMKEFIYDTHDAHVCQCESAEFSRLQRAIAQAEGKE